jgi:type IV pilus assembly protein PilC
MPVFSYKAIDSNTNKISEGKLEADNLRGAKELLRQDGKIPTELAEELVSVDFTQRITSIPVIGPLLTPRASLKDINIMTQQLSTLIDAGVPLIESIYLLEQQSSNKRLKDILKSVRNQVIAGDSFSKALSRYPHDFSRLYLNMIRAGEVSGEMDKICARLSILLEKYLNLQKKLQTAMIYPAVTIFIIGVVIAVVLIFVVPKFKVFFEGFGKKLPEPTLILIALSDFMMNYWWAIILVVIPSFFAFEVFRRGKGKPLIDQWMLSIPILGGTLRSIYVSRFVRTLGTVVASGVPLTEGLITASETVDNFIIRASLERGRESILAGGGLARPLEMSGSFPIMVVKMIAIGEETGKLEHMLNKAADFLDSEVDSAVTNLTTLIEPIMIVVLGIILTFVALALYMPMFDLGNVASGGG